eukprot:IDg5203t1
MHTSSSKRPVRCSALLYISYCTGAHSITALPYNLFDCGAYLCILEVVWCAIIRRGLDNGNHYSCSAVYVPTATSTRAVAVYHQIWEVPDRDTYHRVQGGYASCERWARVRGTVLSSIILER